MGQATHHMHAGCQPRGGDILTQLIFPRKTGAVFPQQPYPGTLQGPRTTWWCLIMLPGIAQLSSEGSWQTSCLRAAPHDVRGTAT
eukprot:848339-Amphidinium_carterae.1